MRLHRDVQHGRGKPANGLFRGRRRIAVAVACPGAKVAAAGSIVTSASNSPVVGSQTAHVYPVSDAHSAPQSVT